MTQPELAAVAWNDAEINAPNVALFLESLGNGNPDDIVEFIEQVSAYANDGDPAWEGDSP